MLLYNFLLLFYHLSIRLTAIWNPKANAWVQGRIDWEQNIKAKLPFHEQPIWIHCASLGEFEQGRPLIEKIKSTYPQIPMVLSFYSPSGFRIRKNYPHADLIIYLPSDSPANARRWLDLLQPRMAYFVKYEFWLNYLFELDRREIPRFLIAGSFRKDQIFFRWYGGLFRKALEGFKIIFVQNKSDKTLLKNIDNPEIIAAGDPRIDRVTEVATSPKIIPAIADLAQRAPLLILGSSWQAEEKILNAFLQKHPELPYSIVIAPHDISETHLKEIEKNAPLPIQRLSLAQVSELLPATRIILVDSIGLLSSIYQYGKIAFIGGGFGAGVHNILEPVVFGLPTLIGPNHRKFPEATTLIRDGGVFEIRDEEDFAEQILALRDLDRYNHAVKINQDFIDKNRGATDLIFEQLMLRK